MLHGYRYHQYHLSLTFLLLQRLRPALPLRRRALETSGIAVSSRNMSTVATTTAATATTTTTPTDGTNKVKILFLGCLTDVTSVQQSIIKIQQLVATQKVVFDVAFSSVTNLSALQYLRQVYRTNHEHHDTITTGSGSGSNSNASNSAASPSSSTSNTTSVSMPIHLPTMYLQDTQVTSSVVGTPPPPPPHGDSIATDTTVIISTTSTSPLGNFHALEPNLYVLRPSTTTTTTSTAGDSVVVVNHNDPRSGIWNIPIPPNGNRSDNTFIVVASVPPYFRTPETTTQRPEQASSSSSAETQLLSDTIRHPSYIGCDVLLSTEWPQGMDFIYHQQQLQQQQQQSTPHHKMNLLTSYDVADIALRSRPRYHIAFQPPAIALPPPPLPSTTTTNDAQDTSSSTSVPATVQYYQSPPFSHLTSAVSTRSSIYHTGRFIAVCPVPSTTTSIHPTVAKLQKFLHAISIVPLHAMNQSSSENTSAILPNPYTDVVYPVDDQRSTTSTTATSKSTATTFKNVGLSEASARRIIAESNNNASQTDQFRWSVANNKRPRPSDSITEVDPNNCTLFLAGFQQDRTGRLQTAIRNDIPDAPNIILQTLHDFSIQRVRYPRSAVNANPHAPISASYAFLDFPSHEQALRCLQHFQTTGLEIMSIPLQLKWSTRPKEDRSTSLLPTPDSKKQNTGIVKRLQEVDAHDSSTLYFKYTNWTKGFESIGRKSHLNKTTTNEEDEEVSTDIKVAMPPKPPKPQLPVQDQKETPVLRKVPTIDVAGEVLRQWMEETLEIALAGGDSSKVEDRIRAADEPALQVKLRLPKDATLKSDAKAPFCFFHFASHAAASMAIATLTGSTDGGCILEEQKTSRLTLIKERQPPPQPEQNVAPISPDDKEPPQSTDSNLPDENVLTLFTPNIGMYLHWTNDFVQPPVSTDERDIIISEESGFKFSRKHFPMDSRKDCWFCLASSACEKHLITGVYDTCYVTMPKGPVHPGHVLIVPVQHTSQGALKDASVALEMEDLILKLRQHASIAYNSDLFVFERAIQTRGGYHTHVQCIPIPRTLGLNLQSTMLAQGRKYGLDIREINSDLGLTAILNANDNDKDATQDGGYFYAEIAMLGRDSKRFIHKVRTPVTLTGRDRSGVNMQFGREVLALVLQDPKIAHWKSCEVDTEQEAAMALAFRDSFEKTSNFMY